MISGIFFLPFRARDEFFLPSNDKKKNPIVIGVELSDLDGRFLEKHSKFVSTRVTLWSAFDQFDIIDW